MGKYNFAIFLLGCSIASSAVAATIPVGTKKGSEMTYTVNDIYRTNNGQLLNVDVTFDLSQVKLKSNAELVVTPMYVNGLDTAWFEPVTLVGRNRMYWLKRNNKLQPLTFYKGKLVKGSASASASQVGGKDSKVYNLTLALPYADWLETAYFDIETQDMGCANCLKGAPNELELAQNDFTVQNYEMAEFIYVTPVAEAIKMREISARAYIDFVVNRTEINPSYRRNPQELAKIQATIDSVKNDKDINITSLHISGTASPEGSYQNNVRLAKGRTESLSEYVQGLYRFPKGIITTSYEPVDWAGLASFLKQVLGMKDEKLSKDSIRQDQFQANEQFLAPGTDTSNLNEILPHAQQILNIVDGDLEPYARNQKIKSTYPKEYAWLLANVYPALRHSDYRIEFEIKTYTEVSEIIEVMQTNPQKLSLAELFVAANSQPQGSDLYNRAFELAVTMYPNDETANLNAGVNAMKRGEFVSAQRYLNNAGNSAEANYARALLAFQQQDYETAKALLAPLAASSNAQVAAQASAMLQNMQLVDAANAINWRSLE